MRYFAIGAGVIFAALTIRFIGLVLITGIRYWWIVLPSFIFLLFTTVTVKAIRTKRHAKRQRERELIARAEAGHHDFLRGGSGLLDFDGDIR